MTSPPKSPPNLALFSTSSFQILFGPFSPRLLLYRFPFGPIFPAPPLWCGSPIPIFPTLFPLWNLSMTAPPKTPPHLDLFSTASLQILFRPCSPGLLPSRLPFWPSLPAPTLSSGLSRKSPSAWASLESLSCRYSPESTSSGTLPC